MSNLCQFNGGFWNGQNTMHYQTVSDGATSTDAVPLSFTKVLAEAITGADTRVLTLSRTLLEFVFLDAAPTLSLGKVFPETVRVSEWLEIKRVGSGWTNEES